MTTTLFLLIACEPADEAEVFSNPGSDESAQVTFEPRGLGGIAALDEDEEVALTAYETTISRIDLGYPGEEGWTWETVFSDTFDPWVIDPVAAAGDELRVGLSEGTYTAALLEIDAVTYGRDGCSTVELAAENEDEPLTRVLLVDRDTAVARGQIVDGYGIVHVEPESSPAEVHEEATGALFHVMGSEIEVAEGGITSAELGFASSLDLLLEDVCDEEPGEPVWVLGDPGTEWGVCVHDDDTTSSAFWGNGFHTDEELEGFCTDLEGEWTTGAEVPGGLPSGAQTAEGYCFGQWASGASYTSFYLGEWSGEEAEEACLAGLLDMATGSEWTGM